MAGIYRNVFSSITNELNRAVNAGVKAAQTKTKNRQSTANQSVSSRGGAASGAGKNASAAAAKRKREEEERRQAIQRQKEAQARAAREAQAKANNEKSAVSKALSAVLGAVSVGGNIAASAVAEKKKREEEERRQAIQRQKEAQARAAREAQAKAAREAQARAEEEARQRLAKKTQKQQSTSAITKIFTAAAGAIETGRKLAEAAQKTGQSDSAGTKYRNVADARPSAMSSNTQPAGKVTLPGEEKLSSAEAERWIDEINRQSDRQNSAAVRGVFDSAAQSLGQLDTVVQDILAEKKKQIQAEKDRQPAALGYASGGRQGRNAPGLADFSKSYQNGGAPVVGTKQRSLPTVQSPVDALNQLWEKQAQKTASGGNQGGLGGALDGVSKVWSAARDVLEEKTGTARKQNKYRNVITASGGNQGGLGGALDGVSEVWSAARDVLEEKTGTARKHNKYRNVTSSSDWEGKPESLKKMEKKAEKAEMSALLGHPNYNKWSANFTSDEKFDSFYQVYRPQIILKQVELRQKGMNEEAALDGAVSWAIDAARTPDAFGNTELSWRMGVDAEKKAWEKLGSTEGQIAAKKRSVEREIINAQKVWGADAADWEAYRKTEYEKIDSLGLVLENPNADRWKYALGPDFPLEDFYLKNYQKFQWELQKAIDYYEEHGTLEGAENKLNAALKNPWSREGGAGSLQDQLVDVAMHNLINQDEQVNRVWMLTRSPGKQGQYLNDIFMAEMVRPFEGIYRTGAMAGGALGGLGEELAGDNAFSDFMQNWYDNAMYSNFADSLRAEADRYFIEDNAADQAMKMLYNYGGQTVGGIMLGGPSPLAVGLRGASQLGNSLAGGLQQSEGDLWKALPYALTNTGIGVMADYGLGASPFNNSGAIFQGIKSPAARTGLDMLGDTVMGGMSPLVDYRLKDLYGIDAQTPTGGDIGKSALFSLGGSIFSHLLSSGESARPNDSILEDTPYWWKDPANEIADIEWYAAQKNQENSSDAEKGDASVENSGNGEYNEAQGGSIKIPMSDGTEVELPQTPSYAEGYDSHLVNAELPTGKKSKKGVSGGHNMEKFNQALSDAGYNLEECIVNVTPHPTVAGIYEVEYRIPAKRYGANGELEIIPGQYKKIDYPKTVYDPAVISDEQMLQWGREAMEEGVRNNRVEVRSKNEIVIYGYSNNGIGFTGYVDSKTKKITNFFPTLNDRR